MNVSRTKHTSKYWVFTLNNPAIKPAVLVDRLRQSAGVLFGVFQLEKGTNGTPHFQGYIGLSRSQRFSYVKNLMEGSPHWEPRRGTHRQAYDYCTKSNTRVSGPYEFGTFPSQDIRPGFRSDLYAVVESCKETSDFTEVVRQHPVSSIKYYKGISNVFNIIHKQEPNIVPTVTLYYGPTGTGKTRYAMQLPFDTFKKDGSDPWFDGYTNQKVLVFDDFAGGRSKMALSSLLNYLDRYPTLLPVKGSFANRRCKQIIITTNLHPQDWYDYANRQEHLKALARRVHEVHYFEEENKPIPVLKDEFFLDKAFLPDTSIVPLTLFSENPRPMKKPRLDPSVTMQDLLEHSQRCLEHAKQVIDLTKPESPTEPSQSVDLESNSESVTDYTSDLEKDVIDLLSKD